MLPGVDAAHVGQDVGVRVDEAGLHDPSVEVDHGRVGAPVAGDLGVRPDGDDSLAVDGNRLDACRARGPW